VLTSDDISFTAGLSQPLDEDGEKRLESYYRDLRAPLDADPSLIFALLPKFPRFTGNRVVEILDRLSGGAPLFGSVAVDLDHHSSMIIHNGEAYHDRVCLLMLTGHTEFRFFTTSVITQNIFYQKARITSAEGSRLFTIDNLPAAEYMRKLGVIEGDMIEALLAFPILADPNNGTEPRLLIVNGISPDGSLNCASEVPVDGSLSIGFPNARLVLKTAEETANTIKQEQKQNGILFFSCISRSLALADPRSEMKKVRKRLADSSMPFLFVYSGGEICPRNREGISPSGIDNKFNIYALVACIF
jgi:hypothetical protein